MNNRTRILSLGLLSAALVGGTLITQASAHDAGSDDLISKIASRFNLNQTEVQQVFDEHRSVKEAERKAEFSTKLDNLVTKGTITAEQKQKIETKLEEQKARMDDIRAMTDHAARHTAMKEQHAAMQQWLKDNGIDQNVLPHPRGHGDRPHN
jgi:hypothetical protein